MIHVFPMDEEADHDLESTMCSCGTRLLFENGDMVLVHTSFEDGSTIKDEEVPNIKNG